MHRGHRHSPELGKGLRALLMPAFKLWNTLTKSMCVLNWSLQLWLCERIRIIPLWPGKRSPKYVPMGSRTVSQTLPCALCTRADGRLLERLTSPCMKQHLQIHPVRSISYVNRETAVNGVKWVLLCWESIVEVCANGWRDLIKNTDTVTSQAKYFKLFSPNWTPSSREAAETAVNDTWCSNGSWKPISASWECVFMHKSWAGAFLQTNVFFDSNISMELKCFLPGILQCT